MARRKGAGLNHRSDDGEARKEAFGKRSPSSLKSSPPQTCKHSVAVAPWAKEISAAWNRTVKGIFQVGRLLLKAEAGLSRANFSELIGRPGEAGKLPFKYETARRLMTIAEDKRLARILTHGPKMRPPVILPPHWRTLHELTHLSNDQLRRSVEEGWITADMHRDEVDNIRDLFRNAEDAAASSPEPELSPPPTRQITVQTRSFAVPITTPYTVVRAPVPASMPTSKLRLVKSDDAAANIGSCVDDVTARVRETLNQIAEDQQDELFAKLRSALVMLERGR